MRVRDLVFGVLVLAVAVLCVRLGFWQVSRYHQKQRMNAALRATLAAPPVAIGAGAAPLDSVRDRRVRVAGAYDETRQVLLAGRVVEGTPGVEVVTPLVLADGSAVLVDRGWLPAADAVTADPGGSPEPGRRDVTGIARAIPRGAERGRPMRRIPSSAGLAWSARALDLDSLAGRFPYALAPYVVSQAPGPGVPERPVRQPPQPFDEGMHVSYAIQWFAFAAILAGGLVALAVTRGRSLRRSG